MVRKLSLLALPALLITAACQVPEKPMPNVFSLGAAGVATPQPNTLAVAAPLANLTERAADDVRIERIQLAAAPVQTPLPMTVGAVPARSSVLVQAELNSQSLVSGQRYELIIDGTYRDPEDGARKFRVHTPVVVPPPSEGSVQAGTTQAPSHHVEGGRYPPRPPVMDQDVNSAAPPVPTNPEVPGTPTPTGTEPKAAPTGDPPRSSSMLTGRSGSPGPASTAAATRPRCAQSRAAPAVMA